MTWRNPFLYLIIMTALCAVTTVFVRVPLPSKGYFNFGDIAVVFSGLVAGKHLRGRGRWCGGLAGGIGSALADVVGGYAMFAPITLLSKLAEGFLATLAASTSSRFRFVFLAMGGALMVGGYFVGEAVLPAFGVPGALAELIPNVIQAVGGAIGGYVIFKVLDLIIESGELE
jgi:uncharacterized membrane protein